ncbi:Sortase family protein [compost metagenome]
MITKLKSIIAKLKGKDKSVDLWNEEEKKELTKLKAYFNGLKFGKAQNVEGERKISLKDALRILKRNKFAVAGVCLFLIASASLVYVLLGFLDNGTIRNLSDGIIVEAKPTVVSSEDETEKAYPFLDVDFTDVLKRNSDVKAWVRIGAIDLDMPVVQTVDNDFYLNHDIDKNENSAGWVFLDSIADTQNLLYNTVIFGHNRADRQMLGSLKEILDTTVQSREGAGVVQVTTPTKKRVFQVVSVYVTNFDDWEYTRVDFPGNARQKFIDLIQSKNSVEAFKDETLNTTDKFLTFSTCYGPAGTTKRLVVHAKLLAEIDY